MVDDNAPRILDRRSFLRGSSLFAAAIGLSVATAKGATLEGGTSVPPQAPPQNPQQQPKPEPKPKEEDAKPKPEDPFEEGEKPEKSKDGKLYDKEGREYRICPQCGYNMYKQGKMWICENCGYSYVE